MKVTSTEIQNNFGKYLMLAGSEDIIITKNGTEVARLVKGDNILKQKEIMDSIVKEEAPDYCYVQEDEDYGRKATYEEFLKLVENSEIRYEYIDGLIFAQSSPKTPHQTALMELTGSFYNWFKGKKCRPMMAPYDITLKRNKNDINVVQPDLMVICDLEEKLGEDGYYKGVPSLTLEILSGSSILKDTYRKMKLYMNTGVQEYWLVDPIEKAIHIYRPKDSKHTEMVSCYAGDGTRAESFIFEGLSVDPEDIFR